MDNQQLNHLKDTIDMYSFVSEEFKPLEQYINQSSYLYNKIGCNEKGKKHKSLFITFYKFSVTEDI